MAVWVILLDGFEEEDKSTLLGAIANLCGRLKKGKSGVKKTREFLCLSLKMNVIMFVIVLNVFVIVMNK